MASIAEQLKAKGIAVAGHEFPEVEDKKGTEDGVCYTPRCDNHPACFYHQVTKKYYCRACAEVMETRARKANSTELFEEFRGQTLDGYA